MSNDSTQSKAMLWQIKFQKWVEGILEEFYIVVNTQDVKSAVTLAVDKINRRPNHENFSLLDIYQVQKLATEE